MAAKNAQSDEQERIRLGQSAAHGATGDGRTGVPAGEQGISNRPGDAEAASAGEEAEDVEADDEDETADEDAVDEDEDEESDVKPG